MTDFIFFLPRHIIPPRAERAAFLRLSVLCALFIRPVVAAHSTAPAATHPRRGGHWPSAAASNDHISTGANPHPVWRREFASVRSYLPADTADERSYLPADTADERCSPLRKKTPRSGRCTSFASQRPVAQRPYPAQSVKPSLCALPQGAKRPWNQIRFQGLFAPVGFRYVPCAVTPLPVEVNRIAPSRVRYAAMPYCARRSSVCSSSGSSLDEVITAVSGDVLLSRACSPSCQ